MTREVHVLFGTRPCIVIRKDSTLALATEWVLYMNDEVLCRCDNRDTAMEVMKAFETAIEVWDKENNP